MFFNAIPVPLTTALNGSSAMYTGKSVILGVAGRKDLNNLPRTYLIHLYISFPATINSFESKFCHSLITSFLLTAQPYQDCFVEKTTFSHLL